MYKYEDVLVIFVYSVQPVEKVTSSLLVLNILLCFPCLYENHVKPMTINIK